MGSRRLTAIMAAAFAFAIPSAAAADHGGRGVSDLIPELPSAPEEVPGVVAPSVADAELVTVTQRSIDAAWSTPEASDTTICIGRDPAELRCDTQEQGTRYHLAHVGRLEPGARYWYVLESGGVAQPVTSTNPGVFRTLEPPPGRHLFDFVEMNDTHVGEECAGTATNAPLSGQSIPPCFTADDYAARMNKAQVADIRRRDIGLTIIAGDVTSEASLEQSLYAKQIFTKLPGRWFMARGNHDRAGQNPEETACGPDNDCFRTVFFPDRPPGRVYYSFNYRGHHFIALDSGDPEGAGDLTDPAQNAFLRRDLERHRDQRTFIFFHHPVSEYGDAYEAQPITFGVPPYRGGTEFLRLMAEYPKVVGVFNAHTHRNFVSYSPWTGARLPYIESGASKEYPGGYSIVSVYTGGYTRTYHRPRDCAFCREWTHTTRSEYLTLFPYYTLGTLDSRNFTHVYDCDVPTPPPSPPGNDSVQAGGLTADACAS
jgi:3',5'-cyclic-AMP phosphodiesterase